MKLLVTGGSGFIGTNLIEELCTSYENILNLDIEPPKLKSHEDYWHQTDILDRKRLTKEFQSFLPDHVIHLAAETNSDYKELSAYQVNTEGTENLIDVVQSSESVKRLIITSTQFVLRPGRMPKHDLDYDPHTIYGASKVITEKITRNADSECAWTIIRPTNIWGPYHPRYPEEFWKILKKGFYVHPGGKPVIRCYGYVKNVIYQIEKILSAPKEKVNRQTYYVGDEPVELKEWTNGFSQAILGKDVWVVPRGILKFLARVGDLASFVGIKPPIYTSRYESMTQNYVVPMEKTIDAFGKPPYSLKDGIKETVNWLDSQYWD